MNHPPQRKWLSVRTVAEMLGTSRMTVYRLASSGELRAYRIGRSIKVEEKDLAAYLRAADMTTDLGWETA